MKERVKRLQKIPQQEAVEETSNDHGSATAKIPGKEHFCFRKGLLWGIAFALTAGISATIGATLVVFSPLASLLEPITGTEGSFIQNAAEKRLGLGTLFQYDLSRPVNILVMGVDRVPGVSSKSKKALLGRTDTMILVRFDPNNDKVSMVSIPRDSRVDIPGVGIAKINDANVEGGAILSAKVVSETLNDIPIDRYVRVTTDALQELVDLVGGIEVFVPEAMHYEDVTQGLFIDLEPGWQTLNGEQAEHFSRFRNKRGGDIGRVQRQQILIKALRERLQSPTVLPKLPMLLRMMQQYIDTNLSLEEILALTNFTKELETEAVRMVLLPGRFSRIDEFQASYWIIDSQGRDRVTMNYLDQNPKDTSPPHPRERRRLNQTQIAIQNATNEPDLATDVARYLAQEDFQNAYVVDNAPMLLRQTEVIIQNGDIEAATSLKKLLGFGELEASSTGEINSGLTIRLGEDAIGRFR